MSYLRAIFIPLPVASVSYRLEHLLDISLNGSAYIFDLGDQVHVQYSKSGRTKVRVSFDHDKWVPRHKTFHN